MLIILDDSVASDEASNNLDACHGISSIFSSVCRGEHYAYGSRETLKILLANNNLSRETIAIIRTVLNSIATIGDIRNKIKTSISVTYGRSTSRNKISDHKWEVPLIDIGMNGIVKSVLVAENLDDAKAYEHAAKQYQASIKVGGGISLEKSNGGGSTTPEVFRNHIETELRWSICITDSDRLYPGAPMDTTAVKCKDIALTQSSVARHIDLQAREIENIIPFKFIESALPSVHCHRWLTYVSIVANTNIHVHLHNDLKQGVTVKKLSSYEVDTPCREYWMSIAHDVNSTEFNRLPSCTVEDGCPKNQHESCECWVLPGFGPNLLSLVIDELSSRSPHCSEVSTRNDANREEWMNIGRTVYEWGCAPKRTRL